MEEKIANNQEEGTTTTTTTNSRYYSILIDLKEQENIEEFTKLLIRWKMRFVFIAVVVTLAIVTIMSGVVVPTQMNSRHQFANSLFAVLSEESQMKNMVVSPASIQTCLTLAYLGAEGQTAEELHNGLKFDKNADKNSIIRNYGEFINRTFRSTIEDEDDVQLNMANRIYVNNQMHIVDEFNRMAEKYFQSEAEKTDFSNPVQTVNHINSWVEEKTERRIKNLLQPNAINSDTNVVLINAIYFKAKWLHPFSKASTKPNEFYVGRNERNVEMEFMYDNDFFIYADLDELDAKVLEMPYANSNLSMLFILPNEKDGLAQLEKRLVDFDLNEIESRVVRTKVDVYLPKFHIEYDVDLKEPLKKLGMTNMFSSANLSGLVNSTVPQKVAEVKHKAYLDVNEAGSEAAASTFLKLVPMSLNFDQKVFNANHPFVFMIRCPAAVYFAGHVVGL